VTQASALGNMSTGDSAEKSSLNTLSCEYVYFLY
jgi:hypothetical protein